MNWLKAHWPTVVSAAGMALNLLNPSIQAYVKGHEGTAVSTLLGLLVAAYYKKSPLTKGN